jgi:hypothetical protein
MRRGMCHWSGGAWSHGKGRVERRRQGHGREIRGQNSTQWHKVGGAARLQRVTGSGIKQRRACRSEQQHGVYKGEHELWRNQGEQQRRAAAHRLRRQTAKISNSAGISRAGGERERTPGLAPLFPVTNVVGCSVEATDIKGVGQW